MKRGREPRRVSMKQPGTWKSSSLCSLPTTPRDLNAVSGIDYYCSNSHTPSLVTSENSGANVLRIHLFIAEINAGKERLSWPWWVAQTLGAGVGSRTFSSRTGMALSATPESSGIVVLGSRECIAQHQQSSIPPVNGSPVPKPILQAEDRAVLLH